MNINKIRAALRQGQHYSAVAFAYWEEHNSYDGAMLAKEWHKEFDKALAELDKAQQALTDEEIGRISMNICARYCGDGGATWEPDEVSRCMTAIRYVRDNGYLAPSAGLTVEEAEQIMETFATWQEDMIRRKDLEKEERIATLRARLNEKLKTKNQ